MPARMLSETGPCVAEVARMRYNYEEFQSLRGKAERCLKAGDFNSAAAYVEAAVTLARKRHCGFYRSEPLEHILTEIARRKLAAEAEAACNLPGNICGPELEEFAEQYGLREAAFV